MAKLPRNAVVTETQASRGLLIESVPCCQHVFSIGFGLQRLWRCCMEKHVPILSIVVTESNPSGALGSQILLQLCDLQSRIDPL